MWRSGAVLQPGPRAQLDVPRTLVDDACRPRDGEPPMAGSPRGVVYLIGSLRNPAIPEIGREIRALGYDVFDDWHGAGPNADDEWQRYEKERGRTYAEALRGWAARQVYNFDRSHLDRADIGVLVMPAGKSGHLELGYLAGRNKRTFILFDQEPERWDVMVQFAEAVFFNQDEMLAALR